MTQAHDVHPLGIVEPLRFDLPTGEGAPSNVRGLGEFLKGVKGMNPLVGLGKAQGLFAMLRHGLAEPKSLAEHMELCLQSVVCLHFS